MHTTNILGIAQANNSQLTAMVSSLPPSFSPLSSVPFLFIYYYYYMLLVPHTSNSPLRLFSILRLLSVEMGPVCVTSELKDATAPPAVAPLYLQAMFSLIVT